MESPIAYIPMDRRHALARGAALPERSSGAALFADISGFTPLTEALVRALGPQRGAEELPRQLNLVYDTLVSEVDRYGGSVLGFAGDAITCWFDDRPPGDAGEPGAPRAAACALALQRAMAPFAAIDIPGAGTASLAIKVGVAAGPARRFTVGDPSIQTIDVLAGDTLQRMTAAEHHAERGDVIVDEATAAALGARALIAGWRADPPAEGGARFAVLAGLAAEVAPAPWPPLADGAVPEAAWRPWLLPPVYDRLAAGLGAFLTELRPTVALFLRFGGIDYDGDPLAQEKLNAFILWAQRILRAYDGYLLQLTIGDKGSFFYAAFGAPIAHEDDASRAAMAALELREPRFAFLEPVHIGISQGRCRTGAYGGASRRTYGVLGDEVNMAARLMQSAPPGQAIAVSQVRQSAGPRFAWEQLPPRAVKGKAEPVAPFRLVGLERGATRLHEPRYAMPMVGRQDELAFILDRVGLAARGRGQLVGLCAEAGMGKSRLVAEVIRAIQARGIAVYAGECQSYGASTPYLVWQPIWRAFFGLDPAAPEAAQVGSLQLALARLDPALLPRLPLLGPLLGLAIPDNELTAGFDAKLRKAVLESLLLSCLAARAADTPLLLVLEDCHWIDASSQDLLEVLARAAAQLPVSILMAYRPPQIQRLMLPGVAALAHFRELTLDTLLPAEVERLVALKLAQFIGEGAEVPPALVARVNARAQGNPFYVEELLNYMRDQGVDPRRADELARLELPASLHSLILSRIDRLSESQKSLLKVASVIGRLFRASILWGVSSLFGQEIQLRRELDVLSALELTPLDTPDPELTYLFKHIVTQEVTYESLPYATRAVIHEQIGLQMEQATEGREQLVDLLAFHFDRSTNTEKRREYLLRAGAAAQAIYANAAATDYFRRALPLLAGPDRWDTLLRLGQVHELMGQWPEARAAYDEALGADLAAARGRAEVAVGELLRKGGDTAAASEWFARGRRTLSAADDRSGLARALSCEGSVAYNRGDLTLARALFEQCLGLRRELAEPAEMAKALNNLGVVAWSEGDYVRARALYEESIAIQRAELNRWAVSTTLTNLSLLALDQGDAAAARAHSEESVALLREIGDRWALASALHVLGNVVRDQGDHGAAAGHYGEALRTSLALGDRYVAAFLLEDTGALAARAGQPERALRLAAAADALREAIGAPRAAADQDKLEAALAPARAALAPAEAAAATSQGRAMAVEQAIEDALAV